MPMPRVRVAVGPLLFDTALARILSERGYAVDFDPGSGYPDVVVVAEGDSPPGAGGVEIALSAASENGTLARVSGPGWSRRVRMRNLDDLLRLIELEAPI